MKKNLLIISVIITILLSVGVIVVNALDKNEINVLVYGVDGREVVEETERSDAIILVNVNFFNDAIVATSIPRDSYVKITCKDNKYDKINHAFAYGGEECLNRTVSQLFEIKNVYNIMMKFDDVVEIVDYFGLIELIPDYTFCQSDENFENKYCFEKNKKIIIDGKQALAYMRNRKSLPNGDFDRIKNQRKILKILVEKFMKLGMVDKINFYKFVKKKIKTDLKFTDLNIKQIINMKQIELSEYTLKGQGYVDKYYYYKLDELYLEKIKKYYI